MNLKEDVLLKNYSTFKIGGPAKYFCDCENLEELKGALSWAQKDNEKVFVLGGGSNVLFGDRGFDGLVIKIANKGLRIEDKKIIFGAGVSLNKLINFSVENNLTGLEWAAGIPGTAGGAVRGNAGAFGGEMGESVLAVKGIELESGKSEDNRDQNGYKIPNFKIFEFNNAKCRFGYRDSAFKRDRDLIIWEIEMELEKSDKDEGDKKIEEILSSRKEKQPSGYPSAGSVFKNPKVDEKIIKSFEDDKKVKARNGKVPAGWLIEKRGLKGKKIGGAMISEKQANFIVNTGNATADDVAILISLIKQKVRNGFGVQLQEEIEIVV